MCGKIRGIIANAWGALAKALKRGVAETIFPRLNLRPLLKCSVNLVKTDLSVAPT